MPRAIGRSPIPGDQIFLGKSCEGSPQGKADVRIVQRRLNLSQFARLFFKILNLLIYIQKIVILTVLENISPRKVLDKIMMISE